MSTTAEKKPAGRSKAAWGAAKIHTITLPSGFEVDIQVPNLPLLIKTGQIPNHLVDAAIGNMQAEEITREMIEQQADYYSLLVTLAVVDPVIEAEDVASLPFEDVDLIVDIASRNRDVDALGHQLGGLHKSEEWKAFRRGDHLDPAVEGV